MFCVYSTQLKRISTAANLEMQALYQAGAAAGNTVRKDRIILFPEQWQKGAVEGEATEPVNSDQILLSLHLHPWSICFLFSWFIFVKTQLPLSKSWWHEQLDFVIEDPQWEMRTSRIDTLCACTGYITSEVRAIAARVQPVKLSSPRSEWRLRQNNWWLCFVFTEVSRYTGWFQCSVAKTRCHQWKIVQSSFHSILWNRDRIKHNENVLLWKLMN